jgi:hypothetical protein
MTTPADVLSEPGDANPAAPCAIEPLERLADVLGLENDALKARDTTRMRRLLEEKQAALLACERWLESDAGKSGGAPLAAGRAGGGKPAPPARRHHRQPAPGREHRDGGAEPGARRRDLRLRRPHRSRRHSQGGAAAGAVPQPRALRHEDEPWPPI